MHASLDPVTKPNIRNQYMSLERLSVENHPEFDGHEEVVYCRDSISGLKALVAIHSTKNGPALGGCRMWPYESIDEALTDVLRLSQGMSFKHALADTHRGGGKAVILGDPSIDKTPRLMRAFGRFVNELTGRYITAEDVGMTVDDMVLVQMETSHVAGLPIELGGSGDPSPFTAYGVFCGIQAAVDFRFGSNGCRHNSLAGLTVAVQGLGNVGFALCQHLAKHGTELIVTDISKENISRVCERFGATPVEPNAIYDVEADVFAPCALGAVLNQDTVSRLRASIVAGAANNQLAYPEVAQILQQRQMLYAPDFVINAGGIVNISHEEDGYNAEDARVHTSHIRKRLTEIFRRATEERRTTAEVADMMARYQLAR